MTGLPRGIRIVQGFEADVDDTMRIMTDAFDPAYGEAWTRAQCLGILGLPGVWLSLAIESGEPAGFALGRIILDEGELLLLGVRPAWRGRGIGGALLDRAKLIAAAAGARRLHLEVRAGNSAMQLYKNASFVEIGRRPAYYRGEDGCLFDAITLACPLSL